MRVVALSTTYPRFRGDGFGHFVHLTMRELVRLGHAVTVVAPAGRDFAARDAYEGVRVVRFRYAWPAAWQRIAYGDGVLTNLRRDRLAKTFLPMFVGACLRAVVREGWGADVLFSQWTFSAAVALAARPVLRLPVVLVAHGSDMHGIRPGGWGDRLNRWVLRRCDHVVAVSEDLRRRVLEAGVPQGRVTVSPAGVDSEALTPVDRAQARAAMGLPAERTVITFVGRLIEVKGLTLALEAFIEAVREVPSLVLLIVGDGGLRPALERRVQETGVSGSVRFLGWRPARAIPEILSASDVFLLSSYAEGTPVTVMEALTCGVPVIATAVGGVPDVVEHGVTGWLVPRGDAGALRQAMVGLASDVRLREKMASRARSLGLSKRFDAARQAEHCARIFEAVTRRT